MHLCITQYRFDLRSEPCGDQVVPSVQRSYFPQFAKWQELDTNQRAAILGTAASMNEGKNANEAYKHSWAGMQEQLDIAMSKLQRLVGDVLAPTVVPAIQLATGAMQALGNVISGAMSSPLGGLISLLGTLGGAFIIAVTGVGALRNILGFFRVEATLAAIQTTALAIAEEMQGGASLASAAANAIGATGFGGLAAAAWGAATAVWAVLVVPVIVQDSAILMVVVVTALSAKTEEDKRRKDKIEKPIKLNTINKRILTLII